VTLFLQASVTSHSNKEFASCRLLYQFSVNTPTEDKAKERKNNFPMNISYLLKPCSNSVLINSFGMNNSQVKRKGLLVSNFLEKPRMFISYIHTELVCSATFL
jgi:hypothetical protein